MTALIEDPQIDVSALAAGIGRELATLAGDMEHLQILLSGLMRATAPDEDVVVKAQALDHAFQSLHQLSGVLDRMSEQASSAWRLERNSMLQPISLASLAVRLSGGDTPKSQTDDFELL
jgi:hypothetical protein